MRFYSKITAPRSIGTVERVTTWMGDEWVNGIHREVVNYKILIKVEADGTFVNFENFALHPDDVPVRLDLVQVYRNIYGVWQAETE